VNFEPQTDKEEAVKRKFSAILVLLLVLAPFGSAWAGEDRYEETISIFKSALESDHLFEVSYGYAVFPSVGRAGIGVGGARGKGRVFVNGERVGRSTMTQATVGLQLGAQRYRMIIFFEDERAFREFTSGSFAFSAQAQAVAVTAGASATASTSGSSAGVSGGQRDATTVGGFNRGMAVFTVARGGLMYEASIGGARFSFRPK
jgi:lipid-binding SYLF domain-containing protein